MPPFVLLLAGAAVAAPAPAPPRPAAVAYCDVDVAYLDGGDLLFRDGAGAIVGGVPCPGGVAAVTLPGGARREVRAGDPPCRLRDVAVPLAPFYPLDRADVTVTAREAGAAGVVEVAVTVVEGGRCVEQIPGPP